MNIPKTIQAIVLAAGKSRRFAHAQTKLLVQVCGKALVEHVVGLLHKQHIPTICVVGHEAELVTALIREKYPETQFVTQHEQRGTGHALLQSEPCWTAQTLLVINGDCPLIQSRTITDMRTYHETHNHAITFAVSNIGISKHSYGRVMIMNHKTIIVEAKDFIPEVHDQHAPVNAGIYLINSDFLQKHAHKMHTNNKAGEYYITDLIAIAQEAGYTVGTVTIPADEMHGVNTLADLEYVQTIMQRNSVIS